MINLFQTQDKWRDNNSSHLKNVSKLLKTLLKMKLVLYSHLDLYFFFGIRNIKTNQKKDCMNKSINKFVPI